MNILQLFVQLGIKGTSEVTRGLEQVEEQSHKTAQGVREGGKAVHETEAEFRHFSFAAMEAVYAVQSFSSAIREASEFAVQFSAIESSLEWRKLQIGLENVTGSAKEARDMMKDLKEVGDATQFDTLKLASYAPQLINAGATPEQVPQELKALSDMASSGAMDPSQMPEFMDTMVRMRNMNQASGRMLERFNGLDIKGILPAGGGPKAATANQAYDYLSAIRGSDAYQELLKGTEAIHGNAAAMALARDPAAKLAKDMETLNQIMTPTGTLLLKVIGPAAVGLGWIADHLKDLNEATGGRAGLGLILILIARNAKFLWTSMKAGIRFTNDLAASIERYGAAAEAASLLHPGGASGGVAATVAGAEGAAAANGVKNTVTGAEGAAAATSTVREAGKISKAMGFLKGLKSLEWLKNLRFLKDASVPALVVDLRSSLIASKVKGPWGDAISDAGMGASLGLMVGARVGLPGIIAGLLVGGIGGGIFGYKTHDSSLDASDKHTKALEDNTKKLDELNGTVIGGGSRSRYQKSQMEIERHIMRVMAGFA